MLFCLQLYSISNQMNTYIFDVFPWSMTSLMNDPTFPKPNPRCRQHLQKKLTPIIKDSRRNVLTNALNVLATFFGKCGSSICFVNWIISIHLLSATPKKENIFLAIIRVVQNFHLSWPHLMIWLKFSHHKILDPLPLRTERPFIAVIIVLVHWA